MAELCKKCFMELHPDVLESNIELSDTNAKDICEGCGEYTNFVTGTRVCGDCEYFLGMGDWNLCCSQPHDSTKYPFGFLCYKNTEACDLFKKKE